MTDDSSQDVLGPPPRVVPHVRRTGRQPRGLWPAGHLWRIDRRISAIGKACRYTPVIDVLMGLRKIQNSTAFGMAVEIGVSPAVGGPADIECQTAFDNGCPHSCRNRPGQDERPRTKPRSRSSMPRRSARGLNLGA